MLQATQNKKNFWNPTRETGNNLIRRKLFSLETLAEGPVRVRLATFDRVSGLLFWNENANFAIIPNYLFPLMEFWKFFLFLVGRIILEG